MKLGRCCASVVLIAVGLFVLPSPSRTFDAPVNDWKSDWERTELPTESIAYSPFGLRIDVRDGLKAVAIQTIDTSGRQFKGRKLYVTTSRADGAWSEPVEIAGSDHNILNPPLIRIDSQNHIHVVWTEREPADDDFTDATYRIRYATYDGQEWTEPITLFKRDLPFLPPNVLLIDDDTLHFSVSAIDKNGQGFPNYYVSGRDDDWTVTEVDDGTPDPGFPLGGIASSLAMSASGTLHLVFVATSDDSINDLYHTYSLDEGASWAPARRIYTSGARVAHSPMLRAGPGDALYLAWNEAPGRGALPDEAYHAYLSEDRLLSEAARDAGSEGELLCRTSHLTASIAAPYVSAPSLSVTSSGHTFVVLTALRDLGTGDGSIYYAYWDGQWPDLMPLDDSPGGNATATEYHDGQVYALYIRVESYGEEKDYTVELARQPVPFDQPPELPGCSTLPTDPEGASVTPYPNPTSGILSIDVCPPADVGFVELRLYNVLGQQVRTLFRQPADDTARCITVQGLDVGSLASGVYYVQAAAGGEVFDTSPVVVVK